MSSPPVFPQAYRDASVRALETALGSVPAYAAWRRLDPGPGLPIDERYRALPALTKSDLREHTWRGLVPGNADADAALAKGEIELVETSGTTSERVTNVWYQPWWDDAEARSWRYHAHAEALPLGGHREAILTSPRNTGILSDNGLLTRQERTRGRFLYLNERATPAQWTNELIERIIRELDEFSPVVLEANPSYLALVARYAARTGRRVRQPGIIILTYENPGALVRRQIRRAFTAPLASSYGATEAGYVLMECEQGRLHQVSACCRIDMQPLLPRHGGPDVGRLFVTTLTNPWRSLVRFDVGDLVEIANSASCPCGRAGGYIFRAVVGRTANLTFAVDGSAVTTARVEEAVAGEEGVAQFQLRQPAARHYEVTVVPDADGFSPRSLSGNVAGRLERLYGPGAEVRVSIAGEIAAESSGKFRLTGANFPVDAGNLFDKEQ